MPTRNSSRITITMFSERKPLKAVLPILQSQARAVKGVNQEQLALYYGVGRYISENTRNQKWESGAIETISLRLRQELTGLRGFGVHVTTMTALLTSVACI